MIFPIQGFEFYSRICSINTFNSTAEAVISALMDLGCQRVRFTIEPFASIKVYEVAHEN